MDDIIQISPCDLTRDLIDGGCVDIIPFEDYANPHEVSGSAVFIDPKISEVARKGILWALRVFPEAFVLRYLGGHRFIMLDQESFKSQTYNKKQGFSPAMGIKRFGSRWYINEKILSMGDRNRLVTRIWYAIGASVSKGLEGEEGFDGYRFKSAFVRYLRARIGNPLIIPWASADFSLKGVDPLYQYFLDLMVESNSFDLSNMKMLFRTALDNYSAGSGAIERFTFLHYSPWSFKGVYEKLASRGLHFQKLPFGDVSLTLQSAKMRGRPESSHRINLHYYNHVVNDALASVLKFILPNSEAKVMWSPGVAATYETRTPDGNKRGAALIGSLLDINFPTAIGEIGFHSYLGAPVTVNLYGDGDTPKERPLFDPEWEIGIHFLDRSEGFFMGTILMIPFLSQQDKYFGFALCWQNF